MKHLEENLQSACVKWFRLQYPQYDGLLFHVPNGGRRNLKEAARLKAEGVVAGVADLILLVPKYLHLHDEYETETFHALCIEMKTLTGRQSAEQMEWQRKVEDHNYRYVICRSLEGFMSVVNEYLQ